VNEAEIKQGVKNKKNRIVILHTDDEWLVLKPLSVEASVNYGYGTKWCTSMKEGNSYFHKYSKNGVLIFVINRKNGVKYAFYSSPKEYSVWTVTDARIDSMETTIPFELLCQIKGWTNFDEVGPNYNYFEDEDKEGIKKESITLRGTTGESDRNDPIEATLDVVYDERDMGEIAAPEESFDITENMVIEEGMSNEYEDEEISVHVDIRDRDEEMVGPGHLTHGQITNQGERTWDEPYPNGPGGGFDIDEPMITEDESAVPANESELR